MECRSLRKVSIFFISFLFIALQLRAQKLPTPAQIFEKYMQVSGDFSKIANTRILLSVEPINGNAMDIIMIKDSSHRLYQKLTLYEGATVKEKVLYEVIFIYNAGKLMKIENGKSVMVSDKSTVDQYHLGSYIFSEMAYKEGKYKPELEGIETIDKIDYYKINITSPSGKLATNYYDIKTGYLAYINSEKEKTILKNYREIDGRFYPILNIVENIDGSIITINTISVFVNEPINIGIFSFSNKNSKSKKMSKA